MSYVGKWKFHSIGTITDDDQFKFLSAEEYLISPMPYIDETDDEAVEDEMKERRQMIGSKLAVCEDGCIRMLMPLPEGVSEDEVNAAVEAGHIMLYDGMMTDGSTMSWEEKDGELWAQVPGADGITRIDDGDCRIMFMTICYEKE